MAKQSKSATDSDSESLPWWKKRRADIVGELAKDRALRQTVTVHYGRSAAPGTFTVEAYHNDFPMPLAVIWYNLCALDKVQVNNIYTFEPMRRCGLMRLLQQTLCEGYPKRALVTGAGTKLGTAFMKSCGWIKTEAGWELKQTKKAVK